ncbi:MAG: TolC family protein [Kiritimatiellae bacterium]|nr:TolC family protein [Kiritimatiellia bacterium]
MNDQLKQSKNTTQAFIRVLSATLLLVSAGCVSVPTNKEYRDLVEWTPSLPDTEIVSRRSPGDPPPDYMGPALADDLRVDQAVRIALAQNPRLQMQYERLDRAAAKRLASRLMKNPDFDASVIVSQDHSSDEVIDLGVEVDLLHLILLPNRRRIGDADYAAAQMNVAGAVQTVAYQTRVAYFRFLAAQQQLSLREDVFHAASAGFSMAERLRDAGNIKELDLLNRQAQVAQAQLGVSAAHLAVTEAREDLNVRMGLSGSTATLWNVSATLPVPTNDIVSFDSLEADAIENSLQLKQLHKRIEGAAALLGITRIESVLPALHLGVTAEREASGEWLTGPMVTVEIPLFDFGQAKRPAVAATLRELQQEYAAVAIEIGAAVRKARDRVTTSARRVKLYQDDLVPMREAILHHTHLQYNAMQIGVFQLLQTKQLEIETRAATIDELLNHWIARIELEQIRNGLLVKTSGVESMDAGRSMASGGNGGH